MKTVQLAILDSEYALSLRSLLIHDGTHRVYVVDDPDHRLDGIIVTDQENFERRVPPHSDSKRFIVITGKDSGRLSFLWNAGVRQVVFDDNAIDTVQLAIIAAELRLPRPRKRFPRSRVDSVSTARA